MSAKLGAGVFTVVKELESIPKDLQYIFKPTTIEGYEQYAENIENWKKKSKVLRAIEKQLAYYKDYLPLTARWWSPRRMQVAGKIIDLKKKRKNKWRDNNDGEVR